MTASNLLAWSLQIGVLVLVAALASSVFELRIPRARLFHWQMVLMASLALPLLRPWKHEVFSDTVSVTTVAVARAGGSRVHSGMPLDQAALGLILAGIPASSLISARASSRLSFSPFSMTYSKVMRRALERPG